ncbi:MAG TPA: hypothetical protein VFX59_30395, partial [Polyangiales bacterium]|nr:hypothetical protein [Polyangiales bacterium]
AKCASELVAARGTEGGYLLQACNKSCKGSAACEQSCVEKHSTGAGWVLRAGECAKTNCAAECKD